MKPEDIQRMLADGKRYEQMRPKQPYAPLPWYIQALLFAGMVYLLTGCAASRLDKEATAQDRAACQKDVAPYKGAAWMVAYRDCLIAKGYK